MMQQPQSKNLPLSGMRVVDFCWAIAGPVTTKHLALLGAEVIKVESRSRLDGGRMGTPFLEGKPGVNKSGYFANHNASKLSVRMDMTNPKSVALAKELVKTADIVSESFSAGVISRWGLGYDELRKIKPDLVMISLSMQGQTGPFSKHVGFGRTLSALAGIDHLTGWPNSKPAAPNQPYTDLVVPWFAVTTIISALRERNLTGKGQYIDLAQIEAVLHFLAPAVLDYTANGTVEERNGNYSAGAAPHGVFPCKGTDRWCAIAVQTDSQWRNLCHAIGKPELEKDPRFATLLRRKENEAELDAIVGQWTSALDTDEAVDRLKGSGVPAAVVAAGEDLHKDPQLKHRGHLRVFEHPVMGQRTYSAPSFRMSETPPDHRRAPLLGEHDEYVYHEIMGLSHAEIDALRNEGVFN